MEQETEKTGFLKTKLSELIKEIEHFAPKEKVEELEEVRWGGGVWGRIYDRGFRRE